MAQLPLYYDDICLIPNNYSELMTRDDADTSAKFIGNKRYKNCVIPANMASVVDADISIKLEQEGYFYIMHRFGYKDNGLSATQDFVERANKERLNLVSISTGVNEESYRDLKWIIDSIYNVDVITLDVALAFHKKAEMMINFIKKELPEVKIIAGNVAERKGAEFLANLGVDAIKVGIGQGGPCSTRFQTGFTAPMLWSIQQARAGAKKIPIIADGGVKCIGDIAKAIVFGASMVMCGGLFASCSDSAAESTSDGKKHYYGSASFASKKHSKNIEGVSLALEPDCTILEKMNEINQALASAISYSGGKNIEDLHKNTDWILLK